MTTTPDPQIVNELALEVANIALHDAVHVDQWISAVVNSRFGNECSQLRAPLHTAVAHRMSVVKPSWPDEQPQDERDTRIAQLERELRDLRGTEVNPSPLVLDAQAYGELRDEITATMGDGWDLDEAEISILIKYVRWLAAGQPRDEDGYPIRHKTPEGLGDASGASRCRNLDATTTLPWPAEQSQSAQDGYAVRLLDMLEADPDRFQESEEEDLRAALSALFQCTAEAANLATALSEVQAERDAATQAVAEAVSILGGMLNEDAWAYDAGRARNVLLDYFARDLDALDARDAKAGE